MFGRIKVNLNSMPHAQIVTTKSRLKKMVEKLKHLELKKQAVKILKSRGFSKDEIKVEFYWRGFMIDVAGISKKKKVFIECGQVQEFKFKKLCKQKFADFIHLPYVDVGVIKETPIHLKKIRGIFTAETNFIKIGPSFYLRIPYCITNDSQCPIDFEKSLKLSASENRLIVEEA